MLGLAEVTCTAAEELRDRLLPGYEVLSLDVVPPQSNFHVCIIYEARLGFENPQAIAPSEGVPVGTRAAAAVDLHWGAHVIRFIVCHWVARIGKNADEYRATVASHLRSSIFDFLHGTQSAKRRHVVVLGDLNDEPFSKSVQLLHASRSRDRAGDRLHYQDKAVKKSRLYNCAWRLLGENLPHRARRGGPSVAGTYYWGTEKEWVTLDHVIVSGGLLAHSAPFLDERTVEVVAIRPLVNSKSQPCVSDHLPIGGTLVLPARRKP